MENKVYDVLVNFDGAGSISSDPIVIGKGDYNSITLNFELSITDYTIAMLYIVKPNGKYFAGNIRNNQITFETADIFDVAGYYHYGIALYDEDSRLSSAPVGVIKIVDNGASSVSEEATSDNNFKILDDLINDVSILQREVSETVSDIDAYNQNASEKTTEFNSNFSNKINNINSSILEYEEETYYSPWADSRRIENGIKTHFALTPDERLYTVRFPLWDTSNTCNGEKLDDNVGKYLTPATDTTYEESNYSEAWDSVDCNAVVDSNGVRHITAIKGMPEFVDTGRVDVFCLFRTYYQKIWVENGYLYISRSFVPREGYTVVPMAINKDGTINPWFVMAKYVAGEILDNDGITHNLYCSKGLIPAHYISNAVGDEEISDGVSYSGMITLAHRRGNYYMAGMSGEYMHLLTTFYLLFATKNTQSVLCGNTFNNFQYAVSQAENNVNRVILTTAQANNIDLYTYVSVGDRGSATNNDRVNGYMHNIAYNVQVIGKETIDDTHTALILDHSKFNTTSTTYVSTMHERSGYSDKILGRTGSITSNTNGKHGAVLCGVEFNVGGYEVYGNAIMDIADSTGKREIYVTNDSTKLTSTVSTIKSTFTKLDGFIQPTSLGGWNYITECEFDVENGIFYPSKAGQSGSGTGVGYADGLYVDSGTSGQREFLGLGRLSANGGAGLSCLYAFNGISTGNWNILARLSINGVGGELS